jgi:hypothetical protein
LDGRPAVATGSTAVGAIGLLALAAGIVIGLMVIANDG